MKKTEISVIVPVYNGARYLPQCLKSLLLQTYKNLEIIAVNDGSTDDSLSILQNFAQDDQRLHIIDLPRNKGLSAARNAGLAQARGQYISFIDSDDYVSLCLYEKFLQDIRKVRRNVDIYYFNGFCYYDTPEDKREGIFPFFDIRTWHGYRRKKIFSMRDNTMPLTGTVSACCKIFKASYLREHNFRFIENKIFEDLLFSMQTFLNTDDIYVKNDYLYNYRQHNASTVHTLGENAFDMFFIHDEVEKLFKSKDLYERNKYALFQDRFNEYFAYLFSIKPQFQEAFLSQAKEILIRQAENLDEKIYRNLVGIQKFDELTTCSLQQLKFKYKGG